MTAQRFRQARLARGWSQKEAAHRLRVSQPYVAMLENGKRPVSRKLASRAVGVFNLPPSELPTPTDSSPARAVNSEGLARDLALLRYPGFSYLRPRHARPKNPAEVLLDALSQDDLEARVVEGLPWLLLKYPDVDTAWLTREAKVRDLQNRLGFVTTLARRMAEKAAGSGGKVPSSLQELEKNLEASRLAREETLCKRLSESERRWLRDRRTEDAKHWNVLSDLRSEFLQHAV